MLSDLTLTFITRGKNGETEKLPSLQTGSGKAAVAVFVYNSQTKEVLLREIRLGYTTTALNDIRCNSLLLTFNIDDKSISHCVIDQNRKTHLKSP